MKTSKKSTNPLCTIKGFQLLWLQNNTSNDRNINYK